MKTETWHIDIVIQSVIFYAWIEYVKLQKSNFRREDKAIKFESNVIDHTGAHQQKMSRCFEKFGSRQTRIRQEMLQLIHLGLGIPLTTIMLV